MSLLLDDAKRQVVPRWRPFAVDAGLGLLDPLSPREAALRPLRGELEDLTAEWRRHRTPFHAANLVDLAIVLGESRIAEDAAEYLIRSSDAPWVNRQLAEYVMGKRSGVALSESPPEVAAHVRHARIAAARRSLRDYPRNPILLVDLALEYSSVGQIEKARRAILAAVGQAGENRFVLRSACRFFLHIGEPDEARRLLRRASTTQHDPWLMAAEIVAADAAGATSRLIKSAREVVADDARSPRHITELASALGTLELSGGNRRTVRRLFERAMVSPTENSVAQLAWVSRRIGPLIPDEKLSVPLAFEAAAWDRLRTGSFGDGVEMAWRWLRDEPFARRAASFGSWLAGMGMGDFGKAAGFARAAFAANPDDPRVLTQLIYDLACAGDLSEAERLLDGPFRSAVRHKPGERSLLDWQVIETADRGLLAFRRGQVEEGRGRYLGAIELARGSKDPGIRAGAFLNYVSEEVRADPSVVVPDERLNEAVMAFHESTRPVYRAFVQRIYSRRSSRLAPSASLLAPVVGSGSRWGEWIQALTAGLGRRFRRLMRRLRV